MTHIPIYRATRLYERIIWMVDQIGTSLAVVQQAVKDSRTASESAADLVISGVTAGAER